MRGQAGVRARVGVVGIDERSTRQLVGGGGDRLDIAAVHDPLRFAAEGEADLTTQRELVISTGLSDIWDLLDDLQPWAAPCPVVALVDGDTSTHLRALAHGAAATVSSEASTDRIMRAIDTVLGGDAFVPRHILAGFAALLPTAAVSGENISDEEQRWLRALAHGVPVGRLAESTSWSERHLRRRLGALYLRLGVNNRDQAVALASRLNLI